jgi:putative membrane protein
MNPNVIEELLKNFLMAVVFAALGLVLFSVAFFIMSKAAPFSIRKELEEDQNTALAIVMGAVILGVAIIVAAAIH